MVFWKYVKIYYICTKSNKSVMVYILNSLVKLLLFPLFYFYTNALFCIFSIYFFKIDINMFLQFMSNAFT
ncbi:MAG: hypothetical protein BWX59_00190 [Bacteroidetes bacterium ADurb.Bin028]|nr:MAG: hypothetical protein BWX59_00190 [Bacteroidetes bacterium ADurb.Bin028]